MLAITARFYPISVVAMVELVTRLEMQSASVGVLMAALGGGLAQMRRTDSVTVHLTIGQMIAEIGLSGIAGFLTWSAVHGQTDDHFLVWSSCVGAGLVGSAGLDYVIRKSKLKTNDRTDEKDK